MNILTKEQILEAQDMTIEKVDVSKWWGEPVFVRALSGAERDEFEQESLEAPVDIGDTPDDAKRKVNMRNFRARLAVKTICDESGTRLFTDAEADALGAKNAKPLDLIFDVAQRLSGFRKEDVDELTKN